MWVVPTKDWWTSSLSSSKASSFNVRNQKISFLVVSSIIPIRFKQKPICINFFFVYAPQRRAPRVVLSAQYRHELIQPSASQLLEWQRFSICLPIRDRREQCDPKNVVCTHIHTTNNNNIPTNGSHINTCIGLIQINVEYAKQNRNKKHYRKTKGN